MKQTAVKCILFLLALSVTMTSAAAADAAPTDYDDYSFTRWVNCNGDGRASSFTNSRDLELGGTGDNGMRLIFESAGNNQYYIWSNKRYEITYLAASKNTTAAGEHYLYGTTNKSYALKWRLGDDGRLYTTYNSVEYFLWMYSNENPYREYDAFRLSTDPEKRSYAINYKWMTLTPPHVHPSCGTVCNHADAHGGIKALAWYGGSSSIVYSNSGTLNAGDYYLEQDVSTSTNFRISGNVRICLNGHKLNFTNGTGGFTVSGTGSLELCDCKGTGSINGYPKNSAYDKYPVEISVASASATFHGINYCPDSGTKIVNDGTLTICGGTFQRGIDNSGTAVLHQSSFVTAYEYDALVNRGTMTLTDCSVQSGIGLALYNYSTGTATISGGSFVSIDSESDCVYNGGTLSVGGECAAIRSANGNGIENKGVLNISNANISGTIGILNTSWSPKYGYDPGSCSVSGGTVSGTECGIQNSGAAETTTVDGVETTQIAKATLEIAGAPTISKIILEYPDALTFDYSGETPVDLLIEMGDHFAVGDAVFGYHAEKMPPINLLNRGYGLLANGTSAVLTVTDRCLVYGHTWADATCTQPKTCSICTATEGAALDHSWGDWTTAAEPTYIQAGTESRICTRCPETDDRAIPATGQTAVDAVKKEQTANSLTLQDVPGDILIVVACYFESKLVFIEDAVAENGELLVSVPVDMAWDRMKVFFLTNQWIPIAAEVEYGIAQSE